MKQSGIFHYSHGVFLLFVLLLTLRFVYPEADPSYLKSTEDIHDEAWWAENARQKHLYNRWTVDGIAGALAAGPLSVAWHYAVFQSFGISFFSLRLISLLSSLALLVFLWWTNRGQYRKSALILASLPLIFDWSRLGHPEMMLAFLGILSFLLCSKKSGWIVFLAGIISALALFVKGSYVYYGLPIAFIGCMAFPQAFLQRLTLFSAGFFTVCLPVWLFYYFPNSSFFESYYTLFSADYYSWQQLLNPIGWLYRIVFISSKSFLQDPFSLLFIVGIIIRRLNGYVPINRFGFTFLLTFCAIFLLASDFSPRRFVFLLVLLPLAWNEPTLEKPAPFTFHLLLAWLISLTFMPIFWNTELFQLGFENNSLQFHFYFLPACLIHLVLTFIGLYGIKHFSKSNEVLKYTSVLIVLLWGIYVLIRGLNGTLTRPIDITWAIGGIIMFTCGIFTIMFLKNRSYHFIIFSGIIWLAAYFSTIGFQTRNAAEYLKVHGKNDSYAIGVGLPYSITFLSPVSPIFHPNSPYRRNAAWCIGISSPDFPQRTEVTSCAANFTTNERNIQVFPLYTNRERAWIVEQSLDE